MGLSEEHKHIEPRLKPADWEVKCLGDLANVVGGGTPSTFASEFWNGDINWFTPTEIGSKKYSFESERKITLKGLENSSARVLPIGTILLTSRAGIGDVSILMNEASTNQGFQSLIAKEQIDNEYLYYLVSTLKNIFLRNASGSTFLEISPSKVKSVQVTIPSTKEEQTAIAQVLSDTDKLISSLEKLIEKKKLIKQGAMQQLLTGKKRLPGFGRKWEVKKLGEIGKCIRGVSYNGELDLFQYDTNRSVRLFRSNNIQNSTISFSDIQYVNQSRVKNAQLMLQDDILICMANGSKELVGKAALFNASNSYQYTFGAFMGCFRVFNPESDHKYIFYNFNTYKYRSYINNLLSGSSINNLKPSDIESIEIYHPLFKEQTAISQILSEMESEIESLEQKLNKYKSIKQGMMQELLTGKIRLVKPQAKEN